MNIQTRQAHLLEMGVPQWHARFTLVGAAESPEISVPTKKNLEPAVKVQALPVNRPPEKIENTTFSGLVTKEKDESLIDQVPRPLNNSLSSSADTLAEDLVLTSANNSVVESSGLPQTTDLLIPNLSLGAFVSGNYLVVSELEGDVPYLDEISLLQNILKIVDNRCSKLQFRGGFNWPVFKSPKVLVGHELLHEALVGRWLASFDRGENQVLMSFGEQSNNVIGSILNDSAQQLGECQVVFFDDSLTDLYKVPFRKKDAWKVLFENLDKFNQSSRV
jgi:hypothetical protein